MERVSLFLCFVFRVNTYYKLSRLTFIIPVKIFWWKHTFKQEREEIIYSKLKGKLQKEIFVPELSLQLIEAVGLTPKKK